MNLETIFERQIELNERINPSEVKIIIMIVTVFILLSGSN